MPRATETSPPHPAPAFAAPTTSLGGPGAGPTVTELAGFRLVRRLAADDVAATWLARGDEEPVVLRAFREAASDERIDAELAARERLRGPHVPELLDLATGPGERPIAILRAVLGPRVRDVLPAPGALRAGHLTTLLAPIAALLEHAHECGVALGRLDDRSVRLDATGAPIAVGLARATAGAPLPERFREREPGILEDRRALEQFARSLASLVDPFERDAVEEAIAGAEGSPGRLETALFDCAAPLSLAELVRRSRAGASSPTPGAAVASEPGPAAGPSTGRRASGSLEALRAPGLGGEEVPSVPSTVPGSLDRGGRQLGLPSGLLQPVDALLTPVRSALGRTADALRSRARGVQRPRRGVLLAGLGGVLALVAAIALTVTDEAGGADAPGSSDATPATAPTSASASDADPALDPSTNAPERLPDPAPEEWPLIAGSLVDRWVACAAEPTPACTSATTQSGSVARAELEGGAPDGSIATATLAAWAAGARDVLVVDRQGGAAVIELREAETATASLLVMRSEAGWRVRAVLPGDSD